MITAKITPPITLCVYFLSTNFIINWAIIKAMNNALNLKTGGTKANVRGASSGSVVINYNPTINLSGSIPSAKDDFAQMLKKHKEEILNLVRKENERMLRLAY